MKAAPGLHWAGISWAQGSAGVQYSRIHTGRRPPYPPASVAHVRNSFTSLLQPTQRSAGILNGVFQSWSERGGCECTQTQHTCKGTASCTVTSLHQLYKHQEYSPQLFKSLCHIFFTCRISNGLSGTGPPMSNSKSSPSFQYFPPCPILLTSANARTHGAMVTYARHSFRGLHLRCSAAQTFPCPDRKVFFQIFE